MRVLVFEDNLMWSARLKQSLTALKHEPVMLSRVPAELPLAEAAIVNLGSQSMHAQELVPKLKLAGVFVIAHAGHKEKELQQLGKDLGCDRLASNSQLTFKLADLLPRV
jgi:hypothetical protein